MTPSNTSLADEDQIRRLMDDWVDAARAKDLVRLMAHHAPDVLVFDVVNPLQYVGVDGVRKRTEEWFASFEGPIGYELRDLRIVASDNVAFCHSLNHVSGTKTDGKTLDMWWRATVCFRRLDARWVVTHAHNSIPFDVASGRASLDLKPE